ncbi:unnamed protein product [Rotaria magnacalcarata]
MIVFVSCNPESLPQMTETPCLIWTSTCSITFSRQSVMTPHSMNSAKNRLEVDKGGIHSMENMILHTSCTLRHFDVL